MRGMRGRAIEMLVVKTASFILSLIKREHGDEDEDEKDEDDEGEGD